MIFIFNLSLRTGIYPNAWTFATIIPIPKVNNRTGAGDLRPVALLPIPGKLLERFVHCQFLHYVELNDLWVNIRMGLEIILFINKNIGLDTISVYIDLKGT